MFPNALARVASHEQLLGEEQRVNQRLVAREMMGGIEGVAAR